MNVDPHIDDERFKSLLERWTEGDFTRTDEQALKILADPDDFRREAMEGYATVPEADHAERLKRMRAKLREDEGQSSGGGKFFALPRLMAAAALLALLVVAFWVFPKTSTQRGTSPLAQREAPPVQPVQPMTKTSAEGAAIRAPEGPSNNGLLSKNAVKRSAGPVVGAPVAEDRADDAFPQNGEARDEAIFELAAEETKASGGAKAEKQAPDLASGKPAAPAGPPPGTPQPAATKEYVLLKDEAQKAKKTSPAKNDSAWHDTERRSKLDSVREQLRSESPMPAYSEPVDGWEAFSDYLRQFARLTTEARNHNISGTVRLQFTVGADGTPLSFLIVRGLGFGCDEEAIRLVKGWEWVRGKNPTTTVEVPFVR